MNRMRLIDADKLYNWVRTECNPYGKPTIDFESGNRMLDMIKRSSTAFDKEKVIEELKSEASRWHESGVEFKDENEKGVAAGFRLATHIVEKGGIE